MPRFNGTGPRGEGAMTGRSRGYCVAEASEVDRRMFGFGRRFGLGRVWGWGGCAGFGPRRRWLP